MDMVAQEQTSRMSTYTHIVIWWYFWEMAAFGWTTIAVVVLALCVEMIGTLPYEG
jgi:hypothetical protein